MKISYNDYTKIQQYISELNTPFFVSYPGDSAFFDAATGQSVNPTYLDKLGSLSKSNNVFEAFQNLNNSLVEMSSIYNNPALSNLVGRSAELLAAYSETARVEAGNYTKYLEDESTDQFRGSFLRYIGRVRDLTSEMTAIGNKYKPKDKKENGSGDGDGDGTKNTGVIVGSILAVIVALVIFRRK